MRKLPPGKAVCASIALLLLLSGNRAHSQEDDQGEEAFLKGSGESPETGDSPVEDANKEGNEAPAGEEAAPLDPSERPRDHAMQGFVSVMGGTGWYLVAPYDKNNPGKMCGLDDKGNGEPVCSGRSVWHLDMLGGFGVKPGLEVFAIFRLGLESDPGGMNQPNTRQIGAGIKVYSPSDGLFKIGFGVAPLFDFSDHGSKAELSYDFVIHVPIQAHFDFVPWFGAFIQLSPNISFISEFRLDLTGGIGVQGRFP